MVLVMNPLNAHDQEPCSATSEQHNYMQNIWKVSTNCSEKRKTKHISLATFMTTLANFKRKRAAVRKALGNHVKIKRYNERCKFDKKIYAKFEFFGNFPTETKVITEVLKTRNNGHIIWAVLKITLERSPVKKESTISLPLQVRTLQSYIEIQRQVWRARNYLRSRLQKKKTEGWWWYTERKEY